MSKICAQRNSCPTLAAISYVVVGSRIDAKGNSDGFVAKLARGAKAPAWAYSLGTTGTEQIVGVARSGVAYGLAGVYPDPQNGNEAWFALIAEHGSIKTQLAYGGLQAERANAIAALPAGGFALGGNTTSWAPGSTTC